MPEARGLDASARLPEGQHRVGRAKIDADGRAHAVARGFRCLQAKAPSYSKPAAPSRQKILGRRFDAESSQPPLPANVTAAFFSSHAGC